MIDILLTMASMEAIIIAINQNHCHHEITLKDNKSLIFGSLHLLHDLYNYTVDFGCFLMLFQAQDSKR